MIFKGFVGGTWVYVKRTIGGFKNGCDYISKGVSVRQCENGIDLLWDRSV